MPIAVQRGLDGPFLEYFSRIKAGQIACGTALETSQCVIVEDVAKSPLFLADPRALELKLANEIRAMVCTPLVARAGHSVGVLSVDFTQPHKPSERDLRLLDLLARQAADFIERIQAEQDLRAARERLQMALDTAQLGTWEYDLQTREVFGDERARAMFGLPQERLAFQNVLGVIYPEDRQRVDSAVREAIGPASSGPYWLEHRVVSPDGSLHWIAVKGTVYFEGEGTQRRAVRFTGTSMDITDRKRAEEVLARSKDELEQLVEQHTAKLREAMAELEHMSYSMVHDMRAPLRAMQSFSRLLEEECAGCLKPQGLDYFRRIRESANRLDRLITDALNYNQVVREEPAATPVEVGRLLRGMLETYPNLQAPAADITIEFNELVVLGNESLLTQCFGNLLGNAVKFVPPGVKPRVRVWAEQGRIGGLMDKWISGLVEKPSGHPQESSESTPSSINPLIHQSTNPSIHQSGRVGVVRIWVEDNGIGIPEDAQQKIFNMFQRMHRESEYPGTGIGLAIVRKAVERMGGHIGLESASGKGSKFWIELPRAGEAENRERREEAP
jgi:PAS domain S-box-containing protein